MQQNTNAKKPKYKHDKIPKNKIQIATTQVQQNTNATKCKWNKRQIEQNTKLPKYKTTKYKLPKCKCNQIQIPKDKHDKIKRTK